MQTILAVDDSASMRQLLAHTLAQAGYQVRLAADGMEALEQVARGGIDLVITDHNMPRMDGLAFTAALRADAAAPRLPVLILTTESDPAIKSAGRAAGATGWLLKPFDPARLLEVLAKVAPPAPGGAGEAR